MFSEIKQYGYVAYIDEAGDPGLRRVRPIDENGASEWLVLSAVVLKASREPAVRTWTDAMVEEIGLTQRRDIHYRNLSQSRKLAVAKQIANLPLRGFVICSNKKNMRQYRNTRAEKVPSQQWFYNWCIRLLLERISAFCAKRTFNDFGEQKLIKIEFSERGGIRYSQTAAYQYYLRLQQQGDNIFLKKREPITSMLDWNLMHAYPHNERSGLQLADFVASAFYQAIDCLGPGHWNVDAAQGLKPIMAKEAGFCHDFGVALFPTPAWRAELTHEQKAVFEFYGYDFARW